MINKDFSDKEDSERENQQFAVSFLDRSDYASTSTELPVLSWIQFNDYEEINFCCLWQDCGAEIDVGSEDKETCFLQDHLNNHLDEYFIQKDGSADSNYSCMVKTCCFVTTSFNHLRRHLSKHSLQADLMYKGAKLYSTSVELQDPAIRRGTCGYSSNVHLEYEGEELVCQIENCGAVYHDVAHFLSHVNRDIDLMNLKDRNNDIYICRWDGCNTKCGNSKSAYRRHVASAHLSEKTIACPFCGRFFHRIPKFIKHMKRRVADSCRNWACCVCHKKFYDEDLLSHHIVQHIGVKNCLICGAYLGQAVDMQKHMLSHSVRDRSYPCDKCNKTFLEEKHRDAHRRTHEAPEFRCDECEREFRTLFEAKRHKREHLKKSVFACHVCPTTYDRGSKLGRHFKIKHDLPIPDGFSRFTFRLCVDGIHRLQTRRLIKEDAGAASELKYASSVV